MSHEALSIRNVSRDFHHGEVHAVRNVSLEISPGQIHGLVGVNGAGKTTLVKMCATILAPTAGEISIASIDAVKNPERARSGLGLVLGGDKGFYPRATVDANLRFFADIAGVPYRDNHREVARVLKLVALSEKGRVKVQELSRGQRQRLHIARALLGSPALLLLDEPTNGLDPEVALEVRDLIRVVANTGVGILLTSHSMPEVEELADRITIMDSGTVQVSGSLDEIYRYAGVEQATTFSFLPNAGFSLDEFSALLDGTALIVSRSVGSTWFITALWKPGTTPAVEKIRSYFTSHGISILEGTVTRAATLEDAFLAISHRPQKDGRA